jgi:hypothetical protein
MDLAGNVCGGLCGLLGQLPDLMSHDGKSASGITGPRRFYLRIQRQQMGLLGDGGNHFDHRRQRKHFGAHRLNAPEIIAQVFDLLLESHFNSDNDVLVVFYPRPGTLCQFLAALDGLMDALLLFAGHFIQLADLVDHFKDFTLGLGQGTTDLIVHHNDVWRGVLDIGSDGHVGCESTGYFFHVMCTEGPHICRGAAGHPIAPPLIDQARNQDKQEEQRCGTQPQRSGGSIRYKAEKAPEKRQKKGSNRTLSD